MHRATQRFWAELESLPESVQKLAKKNFELLKDNPQHPSLHFKKVGRFWSARVGLSYRALAVKVGSDFTWVWIGTHDEYDQMVK
jgi:mRNA-degrading endonuclease RelE of RelBE toxin-antitoxin system